MQAVSSNERSVCTWTQQILEYVSRFMTLFPGDVILTGRPPPLDGFPPHGVPVEASDSATALYASCADAWTSDGRDCHFSICAWLSDKS